MKTIIAGSRGLSLSEPDIRHLDAMHITEVVCGGARGIDLDGKRWAESRGIPVKMFPADWDKHGKAAGPIRNQEMADYADALVAFWDGKSRGTADMIRRATKAGLKVSIRNERGGWVKMEAVKRDSV